ncbi:ArgE/DapE family deacylase [candidate division KSB1 bacterium]|nr:ArgE/DapE family deacylase [candidate division KSB1 bacterium]
MTDPTVKLLHDLVAIDSINPSLVPGAAGEGRIANVLADEMRGLGMRVELDEVAPGRPNVVGILEGRTPGRTLMLCGHIDTVGVTGMTSPFAPFERDGKLYGRGAQDMKGGVAAMIGAARVLAATGGLHAGRVLVAGVVDEEYASIGAEALVQKWHADAAVVTEPTDLMIGVGHKGFAWLEIETTGRAAHGSRPREGRDAIFRMGRVLARLEELDRVLQAKPPHPILGTASLHASLINGGRELSVYPDHCVLQAERRTINGENGATAWREAENILNALRAEDHEFEGKAKLSFERSSYEIAPQHALPNLLEEVLHRLGHKTARGGLTFWTDAAILGEAGIPTVIFGPGGAGLHSIEEYVHITEVLACRDALVELARRFCAFQ